MLEINKAMAMRLKDLRVQYGWSLDRAAKETGVSKAMLGQIERGESNPTIATLWKIATGFQTSFSNLIGQNCDSAPSSVVVNVEQLRHKPTKDGMIIAPLFPYHSRYGFELFELTLLPGYERISEPHDTGVSEHVVVISGEVDLLINGVWQKLLEGSAIRFPADVEHGYRNESDCKSVFHNLIHYPSTARRGVR
jgi:transcriptional regulator with XRE-family HTH domain